MVRMLLDSLEGGDSCPQGSGVTGNRRYLLYSALIQEDEAADKIIRGADIED